MYRDKDSRNDIIKATNKIHDCATYDYIVTRETRQREANDVLPVPFHFTFSRLLNKIEKRNEWKKSGATIGQSLRWIAELIAVADGTVSRSQPANGPADTSTSETLFKPKSVLPRVHLRTDAVYTSLLRARMRWWETEGDGGMDF